MLDEETIGYIEKALNQMISNTDMRDRIRWVLTEIPVHSPEDFTLGYLVGSLTKYAYEVAWRNKVIKKHYKDREERIEKEGQTDKREK